MANVYTPGSGFAQSQYVDQMATALPGSLAMASDQNLIDTFIVHPNTPDTGLVAGIGVSVGLIPASDRGATRTGTNMYYTLLPGVGTDATGFLGITVRNQQMASNSNGDACWFKGSTCNVMRKHRVGGRIWVRLVNGTAAPFGSVYWIVSDINGHGKMIGAFSSVAIGTTNVDTVLVPNVVFRSEADASTESAIALVELGIM